MNKRGFVQILAIIFILILIVGVYLFKFHIGKNPNSFCMYKQGCIDGLYCKRICFDAHQGNCLPFGQCKLLFCSGLNSPSAEKGVRYKCKDGTYGCFIKQINTYSKDCDGELIERFFNNIPRGYTCIINDPEFIKNGDCKYI